jgi:hypothetical protein
MPEDDDNIKQVDSDPSRYKNYLNPYKSIEWNATSVITFVIITVVASSLRHMPKILINIKEVKRIRLNQDQYGIPRKLHCFLIIDLAISAALISS